LDVTKNQDSSARELASTAEHAYAHLSTELSADAAVLSSLIAHGRRGSPAQPLSTTLASYWTHLRNDVADRAVLFDRLRDAIRRGETTPRAWAAAVLGECEPALVQQAVVGYLGVTPVSLEWRGRAIDDLVDWVARELPLARATVFASLLALADERLLERLAPLRGRLPLAEADRVWSAVGDATKPVRQFLDDWRAIAGD
jgi:hypothetical protein